MRQLLLLLAFSLCAPAALAGAVQRVFVTNEKSNDVSVINARTNKVEATIPVGKRPRGIGLSPNGRKLYVAVSDENAIAVIDPKTLKVIRKFHAETDPETFAVHPDGDLFISNEDAAKCSVFNPLNGKKVADISVGLEPEGVAISPDGAKVIVTSESSNMVHVITVPDYKVVANIPVGARPRAATFNATGTVAYATSEIAGQVTKIDTVNYKVLNKVTLTHNRAKPKDVLVSKNGRTLYVAGGRANEVFVLDADTLAVEGHIPVGKRVWGLAMNKAKTRLYTTNGLSNDVSVIDTGSNRVIATIPVGKAPWGVAVDY